MNKINNPGEKGFTLIEIIIVITILVIALPSLFAILFSILQQQTKMTRISVVKREGDYASTIMKNTLRNEVYHLYNDSPPTVEICTNESTGNSVSSFGNRENSWFKYQVDNNSRLASTSASINISNPLYLTSTQVSITAFSITCSRINQFSPATIMFSFDVCYKGAAAACPNIRGEEIANMHYQSYITVRNY